MERSIQIQLFSATLAEMRLNRTLWNGQSQFSSSLQRSRDEIEEEANGNNQLNCPSVYLLCPPGR